jgi:hypothetical protein
MSCGLIINKNALWIGLHYSPHNKRWCINLLPFVTLWMTAKGGIKPNLHH